MQPECRGKLFFQHCNGEIDCDADCMWHRWTDICTYEEHIGQFHMKPRCVIKGMSLMNLGLFLKMKWGNSKMGKLIDGVNKLQEKQQGSKK